MVKGYLMIEINERERCLFDMSVVTNQLFKKLDASLSFHGISFTELMVLSHLYNAPYQVMRRVDLAEATTLTASGITRLLNPMEKMGLVQKQKNERDARISLVKLSDAGLQIYKDAMTTFSHSANRFTEALSEEDVDSLVSLLAKLR